MLSFYEKRQEYFKMYCLNSKDNRKYCIKNEDINKVAENDKLWLKLIANDNTGVLRAQTLYKTLKTMKSVKYYDFNEGAWKKHIITQNEDTRFDESIGFSIFKTKINIKRVLRFFSSFSIGFKLRPFNTWSFYDFLIETEFEKLETASLTIFDGTIKGLSAFKQHLIQLNYKDINDKKGALVTCLLEHFGESIREDWDKMLAMLCFLDSINNNPFSFYTKIKSTISPFRKMDVFDVNITKTKQLLVIINVFLDINTLLEPKEVEYFRPFETTIRRLKFISEQNFDFLNPIKPTMSYFDCLTRLSWRHIIRNVDYYLGFFRKDCDSISLLREWSNVEIIGSERDTIEILVWFKSHRNSFLKLLVDIATRNNPEYYILKFLLTYKLAGQDRRCFKDILAILQKYPFDSAKRMIRCFFEEKQLVDFGISYLHLTDGELDLCYRWLGFPVNKKMFSFRVFYEFCAENKISTGPKQLKNFFLMHEEFHSKKFVFYTQTLEVADKSKISFKCFRNFLASDTFVRIYVSWKNNLNIPKPVDSVIGLPTENILVLKFKELPSETTIHDQIRFFFNYCRDKKIKPHEKHVEAFFMRSPRLHNEEMSFFCFCVENSLFERARNRLKGLSGFNCFKNTHLFRENFKIYKENSHLDQKDLIELMCSKKSKTTECRLTKRPIETSTKTCNKKIKEISEPEETKTKQIFNECLHEQPETETETIEDERVRKQKELYKALSQFIPTYDKWLSDSKRRAYKLDYYSDFAHKNFNIYYDTRVDASLTYVIEWLVDGKRYKINSLFEHKNGQPIPSIRCNGCHKIPLNHLIKELAIFSKFDSLRFMREHRDLFDKDLISAEPSYNEYVRIKNIRSMPAISGRKLGRNIKLIKKDVERKFKTIHDIHIDLIEFR